MASVAPQTAWNPDASHAEVAQSGFQTSKAYCQSVLLFRDVWNFALVWSFQYSMDADYAWHIFVLYDASTRD